MERLGKAVLLSALISIWACGTTLDLLDGVEVATKDPVEDTRGNAPSGTKVVPVAKIMSLSGDSLPYLRIKSLLNALPDSSYEVEASMAGSTADVLPPSAKKPVTPLTIFKVLIVIALLVLLFLHLQRNKRKE